MADTPEKAGRVYHETHGHVLKIIIDNAAKKNAFSPEMMRELSDAITLLDRDENLWVGLLCANGEDFTAGLDMPKFFGPKATVKPLPEGNIDPFGLRSRCRKPIVTAVQGIVFTIGIEISLAGDIVIAADNSRFCQMESKRGIAPLGGAHFRYLTRMGWGDAMYHLFLCDEFKADRAHKIGLVQEVVPAGTQIERAMEIAQTIAKNAPIGIQITKQAALQFTEVGEKAASYREREGLGPALIPERVMVCMSSNVAAPRVLRTGARIAGRLGARWYAVYVETPRETPGRIAARSSEALSQNIRLAESLGATVVRVPHTADLVSYARDAHGHRAPHLRAARVVSRGHRSR